VGSSTGNVPILAVLADNRARKQPAREGFAAGTLDFSVTARRKTAKNSQREQRVLAVICCSRL
jgi:hypothetical protein